jgi:hypothetical protein
MSDWRTLENWKRSGPGNGQEVLLLMSNGKIMIGRCDPEGAVWQERVKGSYGLAEYEWIMIDDPLAWMPMPDLPAELKERLQYLAEQEERIAREYEALEDLARKPLGAPRR